MGVSTLQPIVGPCVIQKRGAAGGWVKLALCKNILMKKGDFALPGAGMGVRADGEKL